MTNARNQLKLNLGCSILPLSCAIASLCMLHWFDYNDTSYSLVGMNLDQYGGWQSFGDFAEKCDKGLDAY